MSNNIIHKTLKNGLEVYLHPTDFAPVVSLQILVKVGSIDEEDTEGGMAHVLEHMLFKGTKKFPEIGKIAYMVEAAGGDINAYTTVDHTNYYLTAPSDFTLKGTEILLDVVQNSLLDPIELKKELEVVIEEIRRSRDNPNALISHSLFSQVFKHTRMERPVIGYQEIVEQFERDKIMEFYKKWYVPNNMIFIAAGDFNPEELLYELERLCVNFSQHSLPKRVRLSSREIEKLLKDKTQEIKIIAGDWQEARLQFAVPAPALDDPDMPTWDVLSAILGENDSSRLVHTVRNELGLVTSIDASCYTPKYPFGIFSLGFYGPAQNTIAALKECIKAIVALANLKPTQSELLRVSNALKASKIYDQESVDGLTRNASLQLLTTQKMEFEKLYFKKIAAVTGEDVQNTAKQILKKIHDGAFGVSCAIAKNLQNIFSESDLFDVIKKSTEVFYSSKDDVSNISKTIMTSDFNKNIKQIQIQLPQNKKLKINFRQSTRLPLTSSMLVFRGGLISEDPKNNGIAGLTANMLTRGTQKQNYKNFVEELEDHAASISAFAGRDLFGLRFDSLSEQSPRILQMMLDCLFKPDFASTEWGRLKKESLEILVAQKDSPSTQLSRIIQPLLYPDHPYSRLSNGTEETVANIHLDHIKKFWKNLFAANEYILSIAGDFPLDTFVQILETEFTNFFSDDKFIATLAPSAQHARCPTKTDKRLAFFELNREQCHIMLGFRGFDIKNEKRTALEIAANILAGQGGRLFLDLRDQQSLAYSLSASQSPHYYGGSFITYIACATHKVRESFEGLKKHIETLACTPPSQDEVNRARQSLIGGRCIETQHVNYQASQLAMSDAYELGFDYFLKFEERVNKITPEDVSNVLHECLKNHPPVFSAVGSRDIWFPDDEEQLQWTLK